MVIADRSRWNNGLGTDSVKKGLHEAFFNLRCDKVEAKIHPQNGASRKIFRKAGFHRKEAQATKPRNFN